MQKPDNRIQKQKVNVKTTQKKITSVTIFVAGRKEIILSPEP